MTWVFIARPLLLLSTPASYELLMHHLVRSSHVCLGEVLHLEVVFLSTIGVELVLKFPSYPLAFILLQNLSHHHLFLRQIVKLLWWGVSLWLSRLVCSDPSGWLSWLRLVLVGTALDVTSRI